MIRHHDLVAHLRHSGRLDIGCEGEWLCYRGGSAGAKLDRANTVQVQHQLIQAGLVTDSDVKLFLEALEAPDLIGSLPLLIAAWGRRG